MKVESEGFGCASQNIEGFPRADNEIYAYIPEQRKIKKRKFKFKRVRDRTSRADVTTEVKIAKYSLSEEIKDKLLDWAESNNAWIEISQYYVTVFRKMILNVYNKNNNNVFMPREEIKPYEYVVGILIELPHNKLDEIMILDDAPTFKGFFKTHIVNSDDELLYVIQNMDRGRAK